MRRERTIDESAHQSLCSLLVNQDLVQNGFFATTQCNEGRRLLTSRLFLLFHWPMIMPHSFSLTNLPILARFDSNSCQRVIERATSSTYSLLHNHLRRLTFFVIRISLRIFVLFEHFVITRFQRTCRAEEIYLPITNV